MFVSFWAELKSSGRRSTPNQGLAVIEFRLKMLDFELADDLNLMSAVVIVVCHM